MVVRHDDRRTDDIRYYLLFPDGSLTTVDVSEVNAYFANCEPSFDCDGKIIPRPATSEDSARRNGESALIYSDGGSDQVLVNEILTFFPSRWKISLKGMITAKLPLMSQGKGGTDITWETNTALKQSKGLNCGVTINREAEGNGGGLCNRKLLETLAIKGQEHTRAMVYDRAGGESTKQGTSSKEHTTAVNRRSIDRLHIHDQTASGGNDYGDSIGLIAPEQVVGNSRTEEQNVSKGIPANKVPLKPKGWASLFGSNRNVDSGFVVPEIHDGVTKEGVFLKEEFLEMDGLQGRRLVGYFSPRYPGPEALEKLVQSWEAPNCKFYQHRSNWTVFTFDSEADLNRVLENGPYFIYGMTLYTRKMPPLFNYDWVDQTLLPVWVQLPNLPIECWNTDCLGRICTFIGTPQHADAATKAKERLSFARVLVEVDVSMNLPKRVPVHLPNKTIMQAVLYEDIPKFCRNCKKMGHVTESCNSEMPSVLKLYVSRAARKMPMGTHALPPRNSGNVVGNDGWRVQGRRRGQVYRQPNNRRTITNKELARINGEKVEAEIRKEKGLRNQANWTVEEQEVQTEVWVPRDRPRPQDKQLRMEVEPAELRIGREHELKLQEDYLSCCKNNGFDPLTPGMRAKEWGLCDEEKDGEEQNEVSQDEAHGAAGEKEMEDSKEEENQGDEDDTGTKTTEQEDSMSCKSKSTEKAYRDADRRRDNYLAATPMLKSDKHIQAESKSSKKRAKKERRSQRLAKGGIASVLDT